MASIIRGTTPTLIYKFKIVDVSEIIKAYLTIKQGSILIEKSLNDAVPGTDTLSWTLTQEETLSIGTRQASIMLNWVTSDGTRGASGKSVLYIEDNHIEEVI